MVFYYQIDDYFCKLIGIDYNLLWLVIDHFQKMINDNKNQVIVIIFSIY